MSAMPFNPRPARKISYKEQQSVDEILKLVQDQSRKISLSGADYRTQKRLEHSSSMQNDDDMNDLFEDESSTGTLSSDLSSCSPPSTQQSMISWESNDIRNQRSLSSGDLLGSKVHRSLPPLERLEPKKTIGKPLTPRPPPRLAAHESFDGDDDIVHVKRPARPMSARGQRTLPRPRGLTT